MYSSLSLTEKVLTRIPIDLDREQEVFLRYAVGQWIEDALYRLARKVSESTDRATKQLLQRDYTLALTSGSGLLSGALFQGNPVTTEPFFYDRIDPSTVTHSSSPYKIQYVEHPSILDLSRPRAVIYYTVSDGRVLTRNTDGATNTLGGTLAFTANYIPLLTSLPAQLESTLLDEMMGIATEKLGNRSFMEKALENQAAAAQEQQLEQAQMAQAGMPRQRIPSPDPTRGQIQE